MLVGLVQQTTGDTKSPAMRNERPCADIRAPLFPRRSSLDSPSPPLDRTPRSSCRSLSSHVRSISILTPELRLLHGDIERVSLKEGLLGLPLLVDVELLCLILLMIEVIMWLSESKRAVILILLEGEHGSSHAER